MLLVRLVGRTISPWFSYVRRSRKRRNFARVAAALSLVFPIAAQDLQLTVTEGNGLQVTAGSQSFGGVSVLVTDAAGTPVSGASVTFRLPESGPSGHFPNGTRIETQASDANGKAAAWGLHWGATPGDCHLAITARTPQASAGTTARIRIVGKDSEVRPAAAASFEVEVPKVQPEKAAPEPPQQPSATLDNPVEKRPGVLLTRTDHTEERISRGRGKWVALVLGVVGAAGGFAAYRLNGKQPTAAAPAATTTGPVLTLSTPTITVGKP